MTIEPQSLRIVSVILLAQLAVAGCAGSGPTYPVLQPVKASDPDLSCRLLDEEIQEADDLRDQILDEHGDAISDAVSDTAVQAVSGN